MATGIFQTAGFGDDADNQRSLPPACLVRSARDQDLPDLAQLLAESFHRKTGWWGWAYPLFQLGIYEDLKHRFKQQSKHYACLVAVEPTSLTAIRYARQFPGYSPPSGCILGTVELGLRSPSLWSPLHQCLYISNLAVNATHRRRGIARQLLHACEHLAKDWGHQELYLHVLENNQSARSLYWNAGYRLRRIEAGLGHLIWNNPRQFFLCKKLK
jgi:ribosomal protein S18 acetylase RimI-like enzyme